MWLPTVSGKWSGSPRAITGWPILFAVYVPLGLLAFLLSGRFLPVTTHEQRPFDWPSAALSGATFGLLIFGIDGAGHGHALPVIAAELAGAALLGTLFVRRQRRLENFHRHPPRNGPAP